MRSNPHSVSSVTTGDQPTLEEWNYNSSRGKARKKPAQPRPPGQPMRSFSMFSSGTEHWNLLPPPDLFKAPGSMESDTFGPFNSSEVT